MPVDFPNSPVIGDEFTNPNGVVYTWDGVKWVSGPCGTSGGAGQDQTPWLSNIDGAGYALNNAGNIGLGAAVFTPYALYINGDYSAGVHAQTRSANVVSLIRSAAVSGASIQIEARGPGVSWLPNTNMVNATTGPLLLGCGGYESIRVLNTGGTSSGNVGILQSSPAYSLDVTGDVNVTGVYRINGVPLSTGGGGGFWQGGPSGSIYYNGGPVGIGTSTPKSVLDVVKASSGLTPADGTQLFVENAGHQSYVETACANASDSCGYIFSSGESLTSYIIDISDNWNFVTSGPRSILFYTNSSERMRITSTGNVGIGTTAPLAFLDINQNGNMPYWSGSNNANGGFRVGSYAWTSAAALFMGVDVGGSPFSWLQATQPGVSNNLLALNPSGGNVSVNGPGVTQALTVHGAIGCDNFASFGGDQTSQVNASTWYGIGSPNNLANGIQVAGWGGLQFCTSGRSDGSQLFLSANAHVGVGSRNPRVTLTVIPPANPTTWSDFQLCVGEVSDNGGYGMYLGYQVGGDGAGRIQAIANSGGSVLYLNPQGGDVQIPASNVYISNHTCFAAAMQANNFNGGDFSGGRVTCNNWVIINGGGIQFPDGSQQGTAATGSAYTGPTNFVGHSQGDRPLNTQFVNSTGKPMWVSVETSGGSYAINAYVAGNMVVQQSVNGSGTCFFCVLPGQAYQVNAPTWQGWWEWY